MKKTYPKIPALGINGKQLCFSMPATIMMTITNTTKANLLMQLNLSSNILSDTALNFSVMWSDEDGIGGNDPILSDTIFLVKDSVYEVTAKFYHINDGEKEEVNTEILKEANDHLICYTNLSLATVVHLELKRTDFDPQNRELGINTTWKGLFPHTSGMMVSLKHQPNIKNGSCDIGETDVEVAFPYRVN